MVYPMKETKSEILRTAKVKISSLCVIWQNERKDAQRRAIWPKQHTKERVLQLHSRLRTGVEMHGQESLFHSLFAWWISICESYDQVTEAAFTAQKVVHSSKEVT